MEHYFNVKLATKYGIEKAIILHTFYYWIKKNALSNKAIEDGKVWTFSSVKVLTSWFPYMNDAKLYRVISFLVKDGLLEKGNYNRNQFDRTAWYTFTEKGYSELASCDYDISFLQSITMDLQTQQNPFNENVKCINKDSKKDIEENSEKDIYNITETENFRDGKNPSRETEMYVMKINEQGVKTFTTEDLFNQWWNVYDKKVGKDACIKAWARMSQIEKEKCIMATPAYVQATPDKAFRKDPLTYLHRRGWKDEIIIKPMFNQPTKAERQDYEREQRERDIAARMARMLAEDEQERGTGTL